MMQINAIDPIVLGHNQFFGVNHLSSASGSEKARRFNNPDNVLGLIDYSVKLGVRGLMLSTHPNVPMITDRIKQDLELRDKLNIYPLLPYISKYVRSSNEKGIVNVILDMVRGAGIDDKLKLMLSGGMGLFQKDILKLLKTLIDVELMPFKGTNIKAVFLHDTLTDLALGLDLKSIFELYIQHISDGFSAIPAFATKNLPLFMKKTSKWGIERPLVLSHINRAGFQMNPSREACEECLKAFDVRIMAMGTLASGYLKPKDAYEYIFSLPRIESVVAGVSTPEHARETFEIITSHMHESPGLQHKNRR
ncbi:MAG: hypothetical protein JRJ02_06350 [Deltaproteobacteria bacterium]|nr:hypothetical protein [Deltaproteobacteria bacterium]MBW1861980.1 hypothetical protein [Deltaproteobacteria bacterium]